MIQLVVSRVNAKPKLCEGAPLGAAEEASSKCRSFLPQSLRPGGRKRKEDGKEESSAAAAGAQEEANTTVVVRWNRIE